MTATETRFAPWADAPPLARHSARPAARPAKTLPCITLAPPRLTDYSRPREPRSTAEPLQLLEQLSLALRQVLRQVDGQRGEEGAAPAAVLETWKAVATQAEGSPGRRPGRHLDPHRTVERRDLGLASQDRGGEGDADGGLEVVAVALEDPVREEPHAQVDVSRAHARSVAHARRDLHLHAPAVAAADHQAPGRALEDFLEREVHGVVSPTAEVAVPRIVGPGVAEPPAEEGAEELGEP